MTYLIGQILICLLAAALIGAIVGWLLRAISGRRQSEELEARWRAQVAAAEAERGRMRRELQRLSADAETIMGEHRSCEARVGNLQRELDAAQEATRVASEELDDLRASLADVTNQRGVLQSENTELRSELAGLRARREDAERVPALAGRVAELEEELDVCRSELSAAQAAATSVSPPTKAPSGKPAWFLTSPEGERDDLRKIKGVGSVLQRTLNNLGIFHFRQIAGFNREDVEWLSAKLTAFKGRITRDHWIDQAKRLHFEKYREHP